MFLEYSKTITQNANEMKKFFLIAIMLVCIMSCDPPPGLHGDYSKTTIISAQIVNPKDSIGINDTVRVQFEVPDTIFINSDSSKPVSVIITEKDGANCGVHLRIIDTSFSRLQIPSTTSIVKATVGYLNPVKNIFFERIGNKLKAEYIFIPKARGVYYLEQNTSGFMDVNNGRYKLSFKWNYGNINRNFQMLSDSSTAMGLNMNWLQALINQGYDYYGFRAN
jgi:hypothetical protein